MTSDEFVERVHQIIQAAVQRAGGDWKQSFHKEVTQILVLANHIAGTE